MEQQSISISKAGIITSLQARYRGDIGELIGEA